MFKAARVLFVLVLLVNTIKAETVGLFYDQSIPQFAFAASDIHTALEDHGFETEVKSIAELSEEYANKKIVIALKSNAAAVKSLVKEGGDNSKIDALGEQAYGLRTTEQKQKSYWAIGGDVAGGLYGGLQIAENIAFHSMQGNYNEEQEPYIQKRGIKFNIPLDQRIPSFASRGDQDKSNVRDMWDMDFWKEYLDGLARNRYNVLSYWTRHPFPVMIKLDEFPDIPVNDVIDGYGNLVKKMTIDEKIAFWQEVMEHAHNRSIEIFYITWNMYTDGVNGKYGITAESSNLKTRDYFRKCVKQFLLTYPYVSGIGVTAGEHMPNMTFEEREEWLWDTYARGIIELKREQPDRRIRFIHRHWYSSCSDIMKHFKDYPDTFDFSFKYARAHMYSSPHIVFEDFLLDEMPAGTKSWWNVRNDDIFYCRWGDPEFASEFILNFDREKTAGYMMGSDGYTWGRVYCSKDSTLNGQLEINKHWYNFMLWGRLGYNPNLSHEIFKNHVKLRFPETSSDHLYEAWKTASKIIPQTTRFFWKDWDGSWYPEACKSRTFYTVKQFMAGSTMEGNGILNIADYGKKVINKEEMTDITPPEVANKLEEYATRTLQLISKVDAGNNAELLQTKNDITAVAHLGNYYSEKIRGATNLYMFTSTDDPTYQSSGIQHLERALSHWKNYVKIMDAQYHERTYARTGKLDWEELSRGVANDIEIAKTIEKFKIDLNLENLKDGDELPKGTDLTINLAVDSTSGMSRIVLLMNGEAVGGLSKAPFVWTADRYSQLKNMNSGNYDIEFWATDEAGNKAEKKIQITIK